VTEAREHGDKLAAESVKAATSERDHPGDPSDNDDQGDQRTQRPGER